MADPVDRDARVEQVLRRMPPVRPSSACVDAELLAAWSAGGLRPDQAALVERHLADCADCQVMLAAFADSEPVAPAGVPFWHRWRLRWLVPVAAASVAVFAWTMATRGPGGVPASSTTVARVEPAEAPRFEAPSSAPPATAAAPPAPSPAAQEAEARMRQASDPAQQTLSALPPPAPSPAPVPTRAEAVADASMAENAQAPAPPSLSPPPPPAPAPAAPMPSVAAAPPPPPPPADSAQARTASVQQNAGAVPAATASAPVAAQSAERSFAVIGSGRGQNNVMMDGISAAGVTVPVHAILDASRPVDFRPPVSTPRVADTAARAEPPPVPTTWRIALNGRVLQSRDFGATWTAVALDPSLFIAAGSAPVEEVCWLVARGGVVLRSTNGVDFQRTAFPAAASPVSVLAVDASQATVVTDDGSVFMTTNGGATWTRMP